MRKGRLDLDEQNYIKRHVKVYSYDEIAVKLDRDPKSIKQWIEQNIGFTDNDGVEIDAVNDLKKKAYWVDLVEQFSSEELDMFIFHWKKMYAQFKDDVFHTEEIQILDTIKLEILMNRCLKNQNESLKMMKDLASQREREKSQDNPDMMFIDNLDRQILSIKASQEIMSRDFKDLQTKKAAMLKDLKGTREQRIKAIEESKQTFGGLIKKIITDVSFRKEVGLEMEKMRLAMEAEKKRLASPHKYVDGSLDLPLLTSETVESKD